MTPEERQKAVNEIREICKDIGCSGMDPDVCKNKPHRCDIIIKIFNHTKKMKTDKSGNNRTDQPETRGRKPNLHPSTQVSWRIKHDVYQLLQIEQKRLHILTGTKLPLSVVFEGIVKKHLK